MVQRSLKKHEGILHTQSAQKRLFIGLFVGIPFAGYLIFGLYPNIMSIYYSLLQWDGITQAKFVGFFNYIHMVQDSFVWRALWHNLLLLLTIPIITLALSILLADFLVNRRIRENKLYRTVFYFPNVLSTVIISLIWLFMFDGQNGLINAVLKLVGVDMNHFYYLGHTSTALAAVAFTMIWSAIGFYTVILMNAISTIPPSLYENAYLEGITPFQRLFKITLPLIGGVLRVAAIFLVIGVFKGFEVIMVMTSGGPGGSTDVIGLYMFSYMFGVGPTGAGMRENYGYASAIGMLLFVILVGLKLLVDKVFAQDSVEY